MAEKLAELPDGRRLSFPAGTPDAVIERAVRRELGKSNLRDAMADIHSAITGLHGMLSQFLKAQKSEQKEYLEGVSDAVSANTSRLAGELSDAIKQSAKAHDRIVGDLTKSMAAQTVVISKLTFALDNLNKTLDAALGQSLEAMDRSLAHSGESAAGVKSHLAGLDGIAKRLEQVAATINGAARIRRKATRNVDGSWDLGPDARYN